MIERLSKQDILSDRLVHNPSLLLNIRDITSYLNRGPFDTKIRSEKALTHVIDSIVGDFFVEATHIGDFLVWHMDQVADNCMEQRAFPTRHITNYADKRAFLHFQVEMAKLDKLLKSLDLSPFRFFLNYNQSIFLPLLILLISRNIFRFCLVIQPPTKMSLHA